MGSLTVLSSLERPTLSAQVARHILALIQREQLRPGDIVPSEVQIVRDLQASRGSVREAYRTLAALGILDIEAGRRPRLHAIDPNADLIKRAREALPNSYASRIRFNVGKSTKLSHPNEVFDVVLFAWSL